MVTLAKSVEELLALTDKLITRLSNVVRDESQPPIEKCSTEEKYRVPLAAGIREIRYKVDATNTRIDMLLNCLEL